MIEGEWIYCTSKYARRDWALALYERRNPLWGGNPWRRVFSPIFYSCHPIQWNSFFSFSFQFLVSNDWSNLPDLQGRANVRDGGNAHLV